MTRIDRARRRARHRLLSARARARQPRAGGSIRLLRGVDPARTGIRERRFAEPGIASSDLGLIAAERALHAAGVSARDLELIVCATYTPDMAFPSTACIIQERLGAKPAAAFDLQAACSGFVYALVTAAQYVISGNLRYGLVVAAEVNSTIVDPMDQKVTPLFGDGAGAIVVGRCGRGIRFARVPPRGGRRRRWIVLHAGGRIPTADDVRDGRSARALHPDGRTEPVPIRR